MKLFCAILVFVCLSVETVYGQTKNVVLLLGEGAGRLMGAYNHTDVSTPHLDALAASSLLFTRAYASDCSSSPERSAILTGMPQHQNGMYGQCDGVSHFSSFANVPVSLPSLLKAHNIRTGYIGRKNVQPSSLYKFDFEATEDSYGLNQIGRNITLIKDLVHQFLTGANSSRPFFLIVSFYDPSRCTSDQDRQTLGQFCEKMGNGQPGMGTIADWKPVSYNPATVRVPHYLPDKPVVRQEIAALYTAISRLDQGVGLIQKELQTAGLTPSTLVMYSSVGGVPFPRAHNDLHETGMAMPLLMSSPQQHPSRAQRTEAVVSTLDLLPTVLDWFGLPLPTSPKLTGKSLLPLLANPNNVTAYTRAFASHNFDEVTMGYPMRVIRTPQYRLIHNLNFHAPYPVSPALARSPTFFDIVNSTLYNQPTGWFQTLAMYYSRAQWELYDTDFDVYEIENDAGDPAHFSVRDSLRQELNSWLVMTQDPWRCLPSAVLLEDGSCLDAGNMEP